MAGCWLCGFVGLRCFALSPHQEIPIYFSLLFFSGRDFFWLVGLVDFRPLYRIPQSLSLLLPLVNSTVNAISEKPFLSGIMK